MRSDCSTLLKSLHFHRKNKSDVTEEQTAGLIMTLKMTLTFNTTQ